MPREGFGAQRCRAAGFDGAHDTALAAAEMAGMGLNRRVGQELLKVIAPLGACDGVAHTQHWSLLLDLKPLVSDGPHSTVSPQNAY
jgi:hypothetical protein